MTMSDGVQTRGESAGKASSGRSLSAPRVALNDGNFALAKRLAQGVMADASASPAAREDARQVLGATRVDRAPIIVGLIMLAVLAVLFAFVLSRPHGG
jgi:hypothetical protein